MKKSRVDYRIWLGVSSLISVLGFSTFYFVSYTPGQDEIQKLNLEQQQLEQQITVATQQKNDLPQKRQENQNMEQELSDFHQMVPDKADLSPLLNEIKAGATQNGVDFKTITKVSSNETSGAIQKIAFTTELTGSFPDLFRYMEWLNQQKRFMNIDGLSLALRENGQVTTSSTITAFMYNPAELQKSEEASTTPESQTTPASTTEGSSTAEPQPDAPSDGQTAKTTEGNP